MYRKVMLLMLTKLLQLLPKLSSKIINSMASKSAVLKPVLSYTEKSWITSYNRQYSKNIKIKLKSHNINNHNIIGGRINVFFLFCWQLLQKPIGVLNSFSKTCINSNKSWFFLSFWICKWWRSWYFFIKFF